MWLLNIFVCENVEVGLTGTEAVSMTTPPAWATDTPGLHGKELWERWLDSGHLELPVGLHASKSHLRLSFGIQ
jgi:hypothetical protein